MQPEIFEPWTKASRFILDAAKELGELNGKFLERFSQQQLDLATASVDAGVKGAQLVSEPRAYKDLVSGQAALASEYGERVLKIARKSNETATEFRDAYSVWLEGRVREAVAPFVKAATAPTGKKVA